MEKQRQQQPPERSAFSVAAAGEEEEEDGNEEMTVETFFALVRNFKEMRDRQCKALMIGCDGDEAAAGEKKRKKMTTVTNRSTWIPRFEMEDFEEDFPVREPAKEETPVMMMKKKTKVENGEDCLDLNLGL